MYQKQTNGSLTIKQNSAGNGTAQLQIATIGAEELSLSIHTNIQPAFKEFMDKGVLDMKKLASANPFLTLKELVSQKWTDNKSLPARVKSEVSQEIEAPRPALEGFDDEYSV